MPEAGLFPQSTYERRLKKLRLKQRQNKCPHSLFTSPENRRYYSGFTGADSGPTDSAGALLITPDRQYLLTDSRFTEAAKNEAPLFEVVLVKNGLAKTVAKLGSFSEGLGIESEILTVEVYHALRKALSAPLIKLPFSRQLRMVKDASELALMKKALAITEEAMGMLWAELKPGWTEAQAARFMDRTFRELGAEGVAFETIVASGPQAALPHARPGSKVIQKGELVVIDCGARYQGYCSDITRMFMVGRPSSWQKKIYRVVREAQLKAVKALGPKKIGAEVHQVAFDHIDQAGFGRNFGHSLGHGVGLAIHETPNLSPNNREPLPVGAVVTVEPGIYLPGQGGVRLEQMAVITKTGCLLLNQDNHFYDF
ncbi:MAG: Xaa-Pro peptidase family protein [Deltaproteobacteria bacterium]|jgi:Xaa-Pro aminopeptidase|nr:Xaa-Pro peptidase family protein [Deltaproteobacteria bacterium]